jgi:hypothetical protein
MNFTNQGQGVDETQNCFALVGDPKFARTNAAAKPKSPMSGHPTLAEATRNPKPNLPVPRHPYFTNQGQYTGETQ